MFRSTLVVAALLGFALAAPAHAHEGKATTTQKALSFEGYIESVNVPAQDFTVRNVENGTTHEMKFHVADPVGIRLDGHVVLLSELHKGDRITVTYEESGMSHVARGVHRHAKTTSR
jgi:hypothetical protein